MEDYTKRLDPKWEPVIFRARTTPVKMTLDLAFPPTDVRHTSPAKGKIKPIPYAKAKHMVKRMPAKLFNGKVIYFHYNEYWLILGVYEHRPEIMYPYGVYSVLCLSIDTAAKVYAKEHCLDSLEDVAVVSNAWEDFYLALKAAYAGCTLNDNVLGRFEHYLNLGDGRKPFNLNGKSYHINWPHGHDFAL